MLEVEKQTVVKVVNDLWAHDAWKWGNTCASLINHEINFDAPAIIDIDGEYITANVYVNDGREFQIGYQEGGWWMCFIKDSSDPRARLTNACSGLSLYARPRCMIVTVKAAITIVGSAVIRSAANAKVRWLICKFTYSIARMKHGTQTGR